MRVNFLDPKTNKHGCYRCPKCGSDNRVAEKNDEGVPRVRCDNCGLIERMEK